MVELLSPVRDEVSFTAAVDAGADAVYLGLGELNMRVNSPGIERGQLGRIVDTKTGEALDVANGYVISPKDLCALGICDQLMGRPGPADWSDRYGSRAHRKKDYVGKVLNFYKEKKDQLQKSG